MYSIVGRRDGTMVFGYNDDDEDAKILLNAHCSLTDGNFKSEALKKESHILMLSPEIHLLKYMK